MHTNKYDYLLNLWAQHDSFRPQFRKINLQDGEAIAICEGHSTIKIPARLCGKEYKPIEKYPNVQKLYKEIKQFIKGEITTVHLMQDIMQADASWSCKKMKCKKCKGDGEVLCNECEHKHECEDCKGEGLGHADVPFGRLSLRGNNVRIFDRSFNIKFINMVLMAAMLLQAEEIEFIFPTPDKHSCIARIGEVEIMIISLKESEQD